MFTLFRARKLGVTFVSVHKILVAKKEAGELEGKGSAVLAAEVFAELVEKNPAAFAEAGLDLDTIMAFIEKIVQIFMMLLPIFI